MQDSDDQPHFRFNPRAYEPGQAFEASDKICGSCARPCVWEHVAGVYARTEVTLCARCVAAGGLEGVLGGRYSFHDGEVEDCDPALEAELMERSPGVACFNPFVWPAPGGVPLAFLGYGEEGALPAIPAVEAAMAAAFAELGWDAGPSPHAMIFRTLDGETYRVVVDLD
ncbi:MAG: CbrC family protein [Sphingopyxis sp.]|nr:CbrC family protein [Sphingopyxis sp.]